MMWLNETVFNVAFVVDECLCLFCSFLLMFELTEFSHGEYSYDLQIASIFVPTVVTMSLLTFFGW